MFGFASICTLMHVLDERSPLCGLDAARSLTFPLLNASLLLQNLHPNVAASVGSACTSGQPEPSHGLHAIGLSRVEANASIRLGVGRFTTASDVDQSASRRRLAG